MNHPTDGEWDTTYQESSPSNSPEFKSKLSQKNKFGGRSFHPYYYLYEINQLDEYSESYTQYDVEKWAHDDWDSFDIDIENRYKISSKSMIRFRNNWFINNYGSSYYFLDVLHYDFNKYQQDLYKYFCIDI